MASASSTSASSASGSSGGGASTVASSSASGSSGAGCSGTGEARDPSSGHCYWNDPNPADILAFSLARSTCMAWAPGADLVSIDSAAEASFVLNKLNVVKDTWVGLSDLATPGVYTWVDGTALSYTDWDTGFPDDGQGQNRCVSYDASLAWANTPCGAGRLVLCEQP